MRITYRPHSGNLQYWKDRWSGGIRDSGRLDTGSYPGAQAMKTIIGDRPEGPVLEAGCGLGRVPLYFHWQGVDIVGMDIVSSILDSIAKTEPGLPLCSGSVCALPFKDQAFSAVLAFGLYHNLETGLEEALDETDRVLKSGGWLCASFRQDNLHNRLVDYSRRPKKNAQRSFHKINFTVADVRQFFRRTSMEITEIEFVTNMPLAYRLKFLRAKSQREFIEENARGEGYLLSPLGEIVEKSLQLIFGKQISSVMVVYARKP